MYYLDSFVIFYLVAYWEASEILRGDIDSLQASASQCYQPFVSEILFQEIPWNMFSPFKRPLAEISA